MVGLVQSVLRMLYLLASILMIWVNQHEPKIVHQPEPADAVVGISAFGVAVAVLAILASGPIAMAMAEMFEGVYKKVSDEEFILRTRRWWLSY